MLLEKEKEAFVSSFKTKSEGVEYILKNYPDARNCDNLMCILYWQLIEGAEEIDDLLNVSSSESLRRVRQKIQNERHKYLPTSEEVIKKRRRYNRVISETISNL